MVPLADEPPQRRTPHDRPADGREAAARGLRAPVGVDHPRPGDAAARVRLHELGAARRRRRARATASGLTREHRLAAACARCPRLRLAAKPSGAVVLRAPRRPAGAEPGDVRDHDAARRPAARAPAASAASSAASPCETTIAETFTRAPAGRPRPCAAPSPPSEKSLARSSPAAREPLALGERARGGGGEVAVLGVDGGVAARPRAAPARRRRRPASRRPSPRAPAARSPRSARAGRAPRRRGRARRARPCAT